VIGYQASADGQSISIYILAGAQIAQRNYKCNVAPALCTVTGDGLWHEYEAEIDMAGGAVRMWVDGTLALEYAGLTFNLIDPKGHTFRVDDTKYGCYFNLPLAKGGQFWVDDMAQSTQRIGIPAATSKPAAPTNLMIGDQ
jgi:hypothetical protein